MSHATRHHAINAVKRLASVSYLRTGLAGVDAELLTAASEIEFKFNPYHDPRNGQFTFAPGGGVDRGGAGSSDSRQAARPKRSPDAASDHYRGITASGVDAVKPVSGGYSDANGRHVPEVFAPDPYALSNPAAALVHYAGGSGEDRNYYFNTLDTSKVALSDFPEIQRTLQEGTPGLHQIVNASGRFDSGLPLLTRNLSSAATIGGAVLRANGVLAISRDGRYSFDGTLAAKDDLYDFNPRKGRSAIGNISTAIGRQLPGKPFTIHIIGSKPFSKTGVVPGRRH